TPRRLARDEALMSLADHEDARALLGGARRVRTRVRTWRANDGSDTRGCQVRPRGSEFAPSSTEGACSCIAAAGSAPRQRYSAQFSNICACAARRSQSATPLWNAPSSFTAAIRYRRVSAGRVAGQIRKGMGMDYANTNRGALFRNDDKDPSNDKDRDYSGSLNVEGTEYWISGYVRTSKSGRKFLT